MGEVFRAFDRFEGQAVALKIIPVDGQDLGWFQREVKTLERLRHPNITKYVDHGMIGGDAYYLAMEWLDGEDLAARLEKGPLGVENAIALIRQVAKALDFVHAQGVVHRDIKPANLFLVRRALTDVRILDFGISRIRGETGILTRTGAMLGTCSYMAPEQIRGERSVSARADLYSLGCVLYQCIAGQPPFDASSPVAALTKALFEEPPSLRERVPAVSSEINHLVERLLAKDQANRPASAKEVDALLEEAAANVDTSARTSVEPPSVTTLLGARERRLLCIVLVAHRTTSSSEDDTVAAESRMAESMRVFGDRFSVRFELLGADHYAALVVGAPPAYDLAARAGNLAHALRSKWSDAAIVVAMGRDASGQLQAVGDVIDRAAALLGAAGEVVLDSACARLLESRFEVREEPSRFILGKPRPAVATVSVVERRMPFVGRDRELAMLEQCFESTVVESRASVMLVTAPAGAGKTRLRDEFLRRVRRRNDPVEIWLATADAMSAGSAFAVMSVAIRRAISIWESDQKEASCEKIRHYVGRFMTGNEAVRVARFLGELIGIPFQDDDTQVRAARGDVVLMGNQVRRACEDLFAAICAERPMLVLLDDLHWGDVATVKLLDGALRQLGEAPFCVIALARPEIDEVLPNAWIDRTVERIQLTPLRAKACDRLVRENLGPERATDAVVKRLIERAAGNAFFLEELIRAEQLGEGEVFPETVLAMAQIRIERLDAEARRMLRVASILGGAVDMVALCALLDTSAETLEQSMQVLIGAELIMSRYSRFAGEKTYAFRHAFLRDAAYEMLTPDDRLAGHLRAAEWFERCGRGDPLATAQHFERGGAPARAIPYLLRVIEDAIAGTDLDGAITQGLHALELVESPELRGPIHLLLASAYLWKDRPLDGERQALAALDALPIGSASWYSAAERLKWAATDTANTGRMSWLRELLVHAESIAAPSIERVVAWTALAEHDFATSNLLAGDEDMKRVNDIAAACPPSPAADARKAIALMLRYSMMGRPGDALNSCMRGAELYRRVGDMRNAAVHMMNAGILSTSLGAYRDAERYLAEGLEESRRLGITRQDIWMEHSLGRIWSQSGRFEEGVARMRRSLEMLRNPGYERRWSIASAEFGFELAAGGRFVEAIEVVEPIFCNVTADNPLILSHVAYARAELGLGNVPSAMKRARAALELQEKTGDREHAVSVHLTLALVHGAAGENAEAKAACKHARDAVLLAADVLTDPEMRRTFVENVPEHARVLALAGRWLAD